ncbi:MAG: hypothetical protein AAFY48_10480, partial [Bacteroidota bacterium]
SKSDYFHRACARKVVEKNKGEEVICFRGRGVRVVEVMLGQTACGGPSLTRTGHDLKLILQ